MPTVPTEQNRVGIAGVTDAKLQPGDYSGTGLQALGVGMQQLGGTGQKIAGEMQERQDRDDDLEVKKAWNAYAEGARGIRAEALGKFDTDPQGMLESMTRDYGGLRDWVRSGLKNDRQRGRFDHVIAERFDYDMSGALGSAEQAMRKGQNQQSVLIEQNAANDAVDNSDNPALFDKHLQTGAESIVGRAAARGDDPAAIEHSVTAYGSGIRRGAVESLIDRDPIAAADRYRLMRDMMTPADRQAIEQDLFEPLARSVAAQEVDKLLLPEERDGTLSPERRASIAQQVEAQPLTDALKRYAMDDLADRGSLQARARKQAADAARETSLATAEQLGPSFTSITQIPAAVRRDLDDATDRALRSLALANLDPTPVASGGETSLMMNIMASENPAALAKEDLRLVRGKVTPGEYETLVRIQRGLGGSRTFGSEITLRRGFQAVALQLQPHSATNTRPATDPLLVPPVIPKSEASPTPALQQDMQPPAGQDLADQRAGASVKPATPYIPSAKAAPANILAGTFVNDPALVTLMASRRQADLASLEKRYRGLKHDLDDAVEDLGKAQEKRKPNPKAIASQRQRVEAQRQRLAAAGVPLVSATRSERALEGYFIGKDVNIIVGNPVDKHGSVTFDGDSRVKFPPGSTSATYTIRGPSYAFTSPDDAAYDAIALTRAMMGAIGDPNEKAGYIIKRPDGSFGYEYQRQIEGQPPLSKIYASGIEDAATIDAAPKNAVAMWHIHPVGGIGNDAGNVYFGEGDVKAAFKAAKSIRSTRFDAYLGASDGGVRVARHIPSLYKERTNGVDLKPKAYQIVGPGFMQLR